MSKTINDVLLKSLTFQTGQTKWDEGSNKVGNVKAFDWLSRHLM